MLISHYNSGVNKVIQYSFYCLFKTNFLPLTFLTELQEITNELTHADISLKELVQGPTISLE